MSRRRTVQRSHDENVLAGDIGGTHLRLAVVDEERSHCFAGHQAACPEAVSPDRLIELVRTMAGELVGQTYDAVALDSSGAGGEGF